MGDERFRTGATGPVARAEPQPTAAWARTLGAMAEHARRDEAVRREDLGCGDRVLVRTRNSVYSLWALGGGQFAVTGGWFDRQSRSPATITVNGCTYGGSVIRPDIVAARGLFLEFGNHVSTTRILDYRIVRAEDAPGCDPRVSLPC